MRGVVQGAGGVTHTYVLLEVPAEFHAIVRRKLEEAGYDHAIHDNGPEGIALDMHGIALVIEPPSPSAPPADAG